MSDSKRFFYYLKKIYLLISLVFFTGYLIQSFYLWFMMSTKLGPQLFIAALIMMHLLEQDHVQNKNHQITSQSSYVVKKTSEQAYQTNQKPEPIHHHGANRQIYGGHALLAE